MNQAQINKALADIDEQVRLYRDHENLDGNTLIDINRIITTNLCYLETIRSEIHNFWQQEVYELTKDKKNTVNRAENIAHVKYPSMYQLRHIMNGAYKVVETIRSHVSWLKSERNNQN